MKNKQSTFGAVGLVLLVSFFALFSTGSADNQFNALSGEEPVEPTYSLRPAALIQSHLDVRDTLYTTDSIYLEVNLKRQNVTVHNRDGNARTFLISSGNPYISEGMSTPTGIFTVQYMTPMAISRQFNDAKLHNWIGVYGGVGFHGLDGSGYYGYLGVRPSSHGCMRMSREQIKEMYSIVHVGAPIIVHNGDPARVVAFCDPSDTVDAFVIDTTTARMRGLGDERIEALYAGNLFETNEPPLVHIGGTRVSWHIDAGSKSRIPRQRVPEMQGLPEIVD
ncbi:MAG: L,D-transpeptidase [Ignavibacteriae bacterium]|nr:L,D-transpeptidase [Ignavibacteriota bacterium]MCB9216357.1 L,D-transpeptidase [Ignavibacteria bacterium]